MAHRHPQEALRLTLAVGLLLAACAPHRMYPARAARSDHRWRDAAYEFNEMLRKNVDGEVNLRGDEIAEATSGRAEARRLIVLEAVTIAEKEATPDKRLDRGHAQFLAMRGAYPVQEIEVQLYPRMEQWAIDCEAEPACVKRSPLPSRVAKLKELRAWLRSDAARAVVASEAEGMPLGWKNLERSPPKVDAPVVPLPESPFLSFAEKKK